MDIFDRKGIKPMLLTEDHTPTDSSDYVCELKLDGIRCLAYLSDHTDLRNKRDIPLIAAFPELSTIHTKVRGKCILDGELIIPFPDGAPDFETMQARSMLTDPVRIRLASKMNPAAFVAFDILYHDGDELMHLPLMDRKRILSDVVSESNGLALSRVFDNSPALFELTTRQRLEGVVQKRKNSLYLPGKRSRDWIKVKNLIDEDFVACGYIPKGDHCTLILGQYEGGMLIFCGHVTLGVSMQQAAHFPVTDQSPLSPAPSGSTHALWYSPLQVCTVRYMERTSHGSMRQPRLKCFRNDKSPQACVLHK